MIDDDDDAIGTAVAFRPPLSLSLPKKVVVVVVVLRVIV